jgi:Zn-dependent M28 family amino/carboxypeptidase
MTAMPGRSHSGPLPPLTSQAEATAARLRQHVTVLSRNERNSDLESAAAYIQAAFGANARSQYFESGGRKVRNIAVGSGPIVVGAHYDSVPGSPGADDNASGVAVLLELAGLAGDSAGIQFIAFANEEMPYFMSGEMGSFFAAAQARGEGAKLRAMLSLEMLGYYRDAPRSQHYPFPLAFFYPDRGDFIAFVGDLGARSLIRKSIKAFRAHAEFPSQGVAAPGFMPGVTWSDHWSYRRHGFPAIMVTDTAFYRYPHYHLPTDTAEKLDYERMARVTLGLSSMLKELLHEGR